MNNKRLIVILILLTIILGGILILTETSKTEEQAYGYFVVNGEVKLLPYDKNFIKQMQFEQMLMQGVDISEWKTREQYEFERMMMDGIGRNLNGEWVYLK